MRATGAVVWLFLLLAVTGCGTSDMGAADGNSATEPAPTSDPQEGDAYWSEATWEIARAQDQPVKGPPTAIKLAVFGEPGKPSDSLDSVSDEVWDVEPPEEFEPGRALYARTRLLVSAADAYGFRLFGVPTEKGWVCLHFFYPNGAATGDCSRELTEGVDYVMSGTQRRYVVYGLVADDVRDVKVVASGKPWPTFRGRNAFVFEADPQKICPTALESLILDRVKEADQEVELYPPGADAPDPAERNSVFGCR